MKLVVDLDEINHEDARRVGGKAAALASLRRAGYAVPRTVCLTTDAYELFVERAALRAVIHQELGRKSFTDMRWEELWDAALRIRNRFLRASFPADLVTEIGRAVADLGEERSLAVRSSALGEDSERASFAGIHESVVGVRGRQETVDAVRQVWASLWTDRALLYRRELGIDIDASAMAVILQPLVHGDASGIAFGVHPTESDLAVVEAVYGLNQGLADGSIEPDRWHIERETGRVVAHIPPAERQQWKATPAGPVVELADAEVRGRPPLDPELLTRLLQVLRRLESLFDSPQDVEWTLAEGQLVLLQARPLTTTVTEDDQRAWYLSLTRSLHTISVLRERIESDLLPAMSRQAEELQQRAVRELSSSALAREIEYRREVHDQWVETYSRDLIPMAHGVRLFGQFYNQVVRPEDPYEFMSLLVATPLLSVRRNRALTWLADSLRSDDELRQRLESGDPAGADFEQELEAFEQEFGGTVYASRRCFADRRQLVRLLLSMAKTGVMRREVEEGSSADLRAKYLAAAGEEREALAAKLLDLGRAAQRIRDDDNLYLSRLESLVLEAVEEGRRRVQGSPSGKSHEIEPDRVVRALRHPNLVVEPRPQATEAATEAGFRALARQLVGQPAGPGIGTGSARVVEDVESLHGFAPGEVLVCDAVDPNITFVVPMAAAVVERRGGMLIHGAIIAREYGLPCVTGVPQATTLIRSGDRLTVDGYLGIVTLSRD